MSGWPVLGSDPALSVVGAIALAVTVSMAAMVTLRPLAGLAQLTHRPELLPQVMAVRYIGQAVLTGFALVSGEARVMLALMFVFALISFGDTFVYARAGTAYAPHLAAGIASLAAVALLLIA